MAKNLPTNAGDVGLIPGSGRRKEMATWSRKWQPIPAVFHGKYHGQRSLEATVLVVKESDMTEQLKQQQQYHTI